jgi:hypothetical protein
MQVSKNAAADFHRRRPLILCAVASQRRGGPRIWLNGRLIILLSFLLLLSFCHSKPQHIPKRLNICTVILKPPSQLIVPGMKHFIGNYSYPQNGETYEQTCLPDGIFGRPKH